MSFRTYIGRNEPLGGPEYQSATGKGVLLRNFRFSVYTFRDAIQHSKARTTLFR